MLLGVTKEFSVSEHIPWFLSQGTIFLWVTELAEGDQRLELRCQQSVLWQHDKGKAYTTGNNTFGVCPNCSSSFLSSLVNGGMKREKG